MSTIYEYLALGVSYVIPMIVLLGVLIFIHELGHFSVAKYFNVKVETFSLGFGPKLWKKHTAKPRIAFRPFPLVVTLKCMVTILEELFPTT